MRGPPAQIALVLRRKAQALSRAVRESEAASAADALRIARLLSSGTFSSAALRRMGHPYRHGGNPPSPAFIINRQSGRFYFGWRLVPPRKSGGGLVTRVVNDSPQARMLLRGTRRMIARPIVAEVRRRAASARAKRHRAALKAVHTGG